MGDAANWQKQIQDAFRSHDDITFMNPRRDDWDSSWQQDISDNNFREQVEWELDHLDLADLIVVYFDPIGKAPISLLELGLHSKDGNVIVCCPEGFWRRGNVQIVCKRYGIQLVETIEELIEEIEDAVTSL